MNNGIMVGYPTWLVLKLSITVGETLPGSYGVWRLPWRRSYLPDIENENFSLIHAEPGYRKEEYSSFQYVAAVYEEGGNATFFLVVAFAAPLFYSICCKVVGLNVNC